MLRKILNSLWRVLPSSLLNRVTAVLQPRFTVTVGVVVLDERGRMLLLKHSFRKGSGWGIPGGFLSEDEQPVDGVRRELREEIGLEIKSLELVLVRTVESARQVQIVYRCSPEGEPSVRSMEIERFDWFTLDALPEQLSPSQHAIIYQALSGKKSHTWPCSEQPKPV